MIPVKSSLIKAVSYDEDHEILTIEFKKGGKYEYALISPEIYKDFMAAESLGAYFVEHIKGKVPHKPIIFTDGVKFERENLS